MQEHAYIMKSNYLYYHELNVLRVYYNERDYLRLILNNTEFSRIINADEDDITYEEQVIQEKESHLKVLNKPIYIYIKPNFIKPLCEKKYKNDITKFLAEHGKRWDEITKIVKIEEKIEREKFKAEMESKLEFKNKSDDDNIKSFPAAGKLNWSNLDANLQEKTLDDILDEQRKMMRDRPKWSQLGLPSPYEERVTITMDNGLIKRCTKNDTTPITIDVVPVTDESSKKALTHVRGWSLSYVYFTELKPMLTIKMKDISVRFIDDGTVFSLNDKCSIGKWSISNDGGHALWQQPTNWTMICNREVTNRIHIQLHTPSEIQMNMVMLFDTLKDKHYLQQDSSFFQTIHGMVMMADIDRNPAWCGEQIHTR